MKTRVYVPNNISIYMRYLHQEKHLTGDKILERFPQYSRATIFRHIKKPVNEKVFDKRVNNPGRPRKLSVRDERCIVRAVLRLRRLYGSFTAKRLRTEAGISPDISVWTIRRVLNRNGYSYLQSRKKGMITRKDMLQRLRFAHKVKKICPATFWKKDISFYFDGTSFVHKSNPYDQARSVKSRAWRKRSEGLEINCTSKGKKAGVQGRVVHFFVSIAYGKGVIACDKYTGRLNGELFAKYVRERFPNIFQLSANPRVKRFLQDGDPSQNSALAKTALSEVGALLFKIPPRSPDINPIENLFNVVSAKLEKDALDKQITHETFDQFSNRVERTIMNFDIKVIDRTIESLNKRMDLIIKRRGRRLKY